MPVYLLHGFRWPRPLIRIHIILQDLEDAAPEWLMGATTAEALIDNLHEQFPDIMKQLPNLLFVEQYDPDDDTKNQPYAYVADTVYRAELSMALDDYDLADGPKQSLKAMKELRARLLNEEADKAHIGWYVVFCGDELREWHGPSDDSRSVETLRKGLALQQAPRNGGGVAPDTMLDDGDPSSSLSASRATTTNTTTTSSSSDSGSKSKDPKTITQGIKKLLSRKER